MESLEDKLDFVNGKMNTVRGDLLAFNPNDIQQLNFDSVQSIEGARSCLTAFFQILLDVNVEKKSLEGSLFDKDNKVRSMQDKVDELMHL